MGKGNRYPSYFVFTEGPISAPFPVWFFQARYILFFASVKRSRGPVSVFSHGSRGFRFVGRFAIRLRGLAFAIRPILFQYLFDSAKIDIFLLFAKYINGYFFYYLWNWCYNTVLPAGLILMRLRRILPLPGRRRRNWYTSRSRYAAVDRCTREFRRALCFARFWQATFFYIFVHGIRTKM